MEEDAGPGLGAGQDGRGELGTLLRLAAPVTITYVCNYLVPSATTLFLGRLGPDELAGAILASLLCNILGYSINSGLLSALDTLCSQAYGVQNFPRVGYSCQRAILIASAFLSPLMVLWAFADRALVLAGQQPHLAALAVSFTRYRIAQMPATVGFEVLVRFLRTQGVVQPQLWGSIAAFGVHVALLWFLVPRLGFVGGPISEVCTQWLLFLSILAYVASAKPHHAGTWPGWSWAQATSEWRRYLRLGFPGLAMLCLEWWSFDFLALGVGHLGTTPLAAHGILAVLAPLSYMIPLGVNAAVAARVGNLLGERRPYRARLAAQLGVAIVFIAALAVASGFNFGRAYIPPVFSKDPAVRRTTTAALPFLATFTVCNYMQGCFQGVLRGAGKQGVGAVAVIVGNYGVAIPLAFVLGLRTYLGLNGFWMGFSAGYAFLCFLFAACIACFNWQRLAEQAVERSLDAPLASERAPLIRNGNASAPEPSSPTGRGQGLIN